MNQGGIDHAVLADAIVDRMKREHHTLWLDSETHAAQHEFLRIIMDERAERSARRKAVQDKIAGSLILSFIVGLIVLLGSGATTWMQDHIK